MSDDPRIPVHIDTNGPMSAMTAYVVEAGAVAPSGASVVFTLAPSLHAPGCACCLPRGAAAVAFAALFARRARGEVPFFGVVRAVTHSAAGRAAVIAALSEDVVVRARFREG